MLTVLSHLRCPKTSSRCSYEILWQLRCLYVHRSCVRAEQPWKAPQTVLQLVGTDRSAVMTRKRVRTHMWEGLLLIYQ